ncbi:PepSY domain-containing protein [Glaciimonas immobilis]|uniref:Sulfite reductase (NADPH) flavoprotein alpha-component n=1 Tax=Glaciimonas immobilis TaxID=728004 RepID=A0A840RSN1_9BURK|nr:sulfite reductase flavoprotein subunit alpha [Glaciimonas immobilis]KAF3997104.1 nitric oxide synthase [Glaciimonas immobilis]MBB5199966.1 sulfite reductase (NADPH) flavoprotein alpha-component [Glaciimonas immobilis]
MFKNILFQIHWFIGITVGTLLMLIGLSGAILSFREELLDVVNPGVMTLALTPNPLLTPDELLGSIQSLQPVHKVAQVTVFADPHRPARVNFAPAPGAKRGEMRYVNPTTGALLPPLQGDEFFEFVERFHRYFLLPRDIGRVLAGCAALGLIFLALSGLYLRWPRRPLAWGNWTTINFALTGRSFLWNLHSVFGTWVLVLYLVLSLTGLYWAFDWFKDGANKLADETSGARQMQPKQGDVPPKSRIASGDKSALRPKQETKNASDIPPAEAGHLTIAWQVFLRESAKTAGYSTARLRVPDQVGKPVEITYLDANPAHERARNQMKVNGLTGSVMQVERYADKSMGGRLINSVYPLHMGTYFGLTGRILMTLTSLGLPLFGITGWMLYLDRRRKKHLVRLGRAALADDAIPAVRTSVTTNTLLVAFASQTGFAESVALRSGAALQAGGMSVTIQSLSTLDPERLRHFHRVLLIVSSFGEGEPPDSARRFARQLTKQVGQFLPHLQYAILALGDSSYPQYCGFGHTLQHWFQNQGAQAFFPMIEVDNGDAAALSRWQDALGKLTGTAVTLAAIANAPDGPLAMDYQRWRLNARKQCNPGSQGDPIFHLEFAPPDQSHKHWVSGALVEVLPRHSVERINYFLRRSGLNNSVPVNYEGKQYAIGELLASSNLPNINKDRLPITAQELADQLRPLGTRRYSVGSIPEDRNVHLLVRQVSHDDGLGLASGWLTEHIPLDDEVEMRLLPNPSFELISTDTPCIFIGNGSGIAGLRSHLRARALKDQRKNWLLFGERNQAHDFFYEEEIQQWLVSGILSDADFAFSRDQPEKIYVQDRLRQAADKLRVWIHRGAIVYVCGSLDGMAAGIDSALTDILGEAGLDDLIAAGRYRRDVY